MTLSISGLIARFHSRRKMIDDSAIRAYNRYNVGSCIIDVMYCVICLRFWPPMRVPTSEKDEHEEDGCEDNGSENK